MCLWLLIALFLLLVYKFGIQVLTCQYPSITSCFLWLGVQPGLLLLKWFDIGAFTSQTFVNSIYSLPFFSFCFF